MTLRVVMGVERRDDELRLDLEDLAWIFRTSLRVKVNVLLFPASSFFNNWRRTTLRVFQARILGRIRGRNFRKIDSPSNADGLSFIGMRPRRDRRTCPARRQDALQGWEKPPAGVDVPYVSCGGMGGGEDLAAHGSASW